MKRKKYTRKKTAKKQNIAKVRDYKKCNNYLERIKITCIKCKTVIFINSNRPELYTKEVKENYVCLNCR